MLTLNLKKKKKKDFSVIISNPIDVDILGNEKILDSF